MTKAHISVAHIMLAVSMLLLTAPLKAQFKETAVPDYYLQYVPLVTGVGLGWTGVSAEHRGLDRVMVAGVGFVSEAVIVNALKYTVKEQRPDGSAHNSFPSGHSATAFLGAEIVRHEYGWGWGAGAYAVATGVAALRVYHKRHYWWDTAAGAACGVLSANIGYWMLPPLHRLLHIPEDSVEVSLAPCYDPLSGSFGPAFSFRF